MNSILFGSYSLAKRIELVQAQNQYDYYVAHQRLKISSECSAIRIGSGVALFAGRESPLTQSFGLGFDIAETSNDDLLRQLGTLEEFFFSHNASVNIELANLTDMRFTQLLGERGYAVSEYSFVLGLPLRNNAVLPSHSNISLPEITLSAFPVQDSAQEDAAKVIAAAFMEQNANESSVSREFLELFVVAMQAEGSLAFGVNIDGEIAGVGGLTILDGIAMLWGAATQPKFRGRGVQKALIDARLKYAQNAGCDIAQVSTAPGTISQENMQKKGFNILYARTKFTKQQ